MKFKYLVTILLIAFVSSVFPQTHPKAVIENGTRFRLKGYWSFSGERARFSVPCFEAAPTDSLSDGQFYYDTVKDTVFMRVNGVWKGVGLASSANDSIPALRVDINANTNLNATQNDSLDAHNDRININTNLNADQADSLRKDLKRVYGEVLANNTFDADSLWSGTAAWTDVLGSGTYNFIYNDDLIFTKSMMGNYATLPFDEKWYEFRYTVYESSLSGNFTITEGLTSTDFVDDDLEIPYTNGTHTVYFKSGTNIARFKVKCTNGLGLFLDNVSLKRTYGDFFHEFADSLAEAMGYGVSIIDGKVTIDSSKFVTPYDLSQISGSVSFDRFVTVGSPDGDYQTITEGLNAIEDETSDNRYVLFVYPGVYEETVNTKNYVDIIGYSIDATTILAPDDSVAVRGGGGSIKNFYIEGYSDSSLVKIKPGKQLKIVDCQLYSDYGTTIDMSYGGAAVYNTEIESYSPGYCFVTGTAISSTFKNCAMGGDSIGLVGGGWTRIWNSDLYAYDGTIEVKAGAALWTRGVTWRGENSSPWGEGVLNLYGPLNADLTVDSSWSGDVVYDTVGTEVFAGDFVFSPADGDFELADATDSTTVLCVGLVMAHAAADQPTWILTKGYARLNSWDWTKFGTISDVLFLSETAGDATQKVPSTSGCYIQVLGRVITPDIIEFKPSTEWTVHL